MFLNAFSTTVCILIVCVFLYFRSKLGGREGGRGQGGRGQGSGMIELFIVLDGFSSFSYSSVQSCDLVCNELSYFQVRMRPQCSYFSQQLR